MERSDLFTDERYFDESDEEHQSEAPGEEKRKRGPVEGYKALVKMVNNLSMRGYERRKAMAFIEKILESSPDPVTLGLIYDFCVRRLKKVHGIDFEAGNDETATDKKRRTPTCVDTKGYPNEEVL